MKQEGKTISSRLKSIKLGTADSKQPDDLSSTVTAATTATATATATRPCYTSDYVRYPTLTQEDLAPLPDPFLLIPAAPPSTPAGGVESDFKIDNAFAEAMGGISDNNSWAWFVKDNKKEVVYVMVLIVGLLIGFYII